MALDALSWYLGLTAGVGAISLSLYMQAIYRFDVPATYTLGLYAFGAIVVIVHLEPEWISSEVHNFLILLGWSIVLALEAALFYDVHTRFSRFQAVMNRLGEKMKRGCD